MQGNDCSVCYIEGTCDQREMQWFSTQEHMKLPTMPSSTVVVCNKVSFYRPSLEPNTDCMGGSS